jgi:hypothetical protein
VSPQSVTCRWCGHHLVDITVDADRGVVTVKPTDAAMAVNGVFVHTCPSDVTDPAVDRSMIGV